MYYKVCDNLVQRLYQIDTQLASDGTIGYYCIHAGTFTDLDYSTFFKVKSAPVGHLKLVFGNDYQTLDIDNYRVTFASSRSGTLYTSNTTTNIAVTLIQDNVGVLQLTWYDALLNYTTPFDIWLIDVLYKKFKRYVMVCNTPGDINVTNYTACVTDIYERCRVDCQDFIFNVEQQLKIIALSDTDLEQSNIAISETARTQNLNNLPLTLAQNTSDQSRQRVGGRANALLNLAQNQLTQYANLVTTRCKQHFANDYYYQMHYEKERMNGAI